MKLLITLSVRVFACVVLAALAPSAAFAQLVDIANGPLFGGQQPHPNVVVATSVEFPSVGAAYKDIPYVPTSVYLGYFDPTQCYRYSGSSTTGSFSVRAPVSNAAHECLSGAGGNTFSGNFMNWATMSAIDEFRYAMTGGNRVSDPSGSGATIERAYLPDGAVAGVPSFYDYSSNFPHHTVDAAGNTDGYPGSLPGDVLPNKWSGKTVYIISCRNLVYISTSLGGSCGSPPGGADTFAVRVDVCDASEGPTRPDLCSNYGTTSSPIWKPAGQIQLNAPRMRFAAFGYLMDRNSSGYTVPGGCDDGSSWNRCRYGGVLRAPMKYVGPTKYDASLVPSSNSQKEVNADGTLNNDPEGTAASAGGTYSGVINYINKFGASGVYKRYDTMGEMYYEAIRYYQNLGPTALATSGTLTNATKDFFPVVTTWTDPIQSTCSANYIINLSDANTWDDSYLPGYSGSPSSGPYRPGSRAIEGGLDAVAWTANIGTLESTTTSITTGDVRPGLAGLQSRNTGAGGSSATYLAAGAAFWANNNDVRTDLPGLQTIKTISFDVAEPSIDVHDRQLYLMGKYGGFTNNTDRTSDTYANPFWTKNPGTTTGTPAIRSNIEWEDSPGSAYPANYLLASDPNKLINGLKAAFAKIGSATGTLSGASLTSANLTYGAANAYIATFDPTRWSGSVQSKSLSVDPVTGNPVVSPGFIWDSGPILTARCGTVAAAATTCTDTDTSVNKRNIVTVTDVLGTRNAVNFTYANILLDVNYLLTLNTNPTTGLPDLLGQQRLNYLRGYRAGETTLGFRARDSVMGDVINSGPVFVGPPTTSIPDTDYQTFYGTYNARTSMVYVGANDGMLHALRASDGVELFAYIPGYSRANLNDLTKPGYIHEVFVDTVPKIQEVKVSGTWKTVLLGANGNGAQGLFALDVTDPTAFGPSKVMFEFSDADDADFGNVLAAPEIAKLRVGPATGSPPVYRYFAVVTGYNKKRTDVNGHPGGDTNVSTDSTNKGVLFLIALDHTLGTPWVLGTDYYKFTFPATNPALPNGLGPVTLLPSRAGDRTAAAMYFGDLQGNLWRFNTTGNTPSSWLPARGTLAAPLPIFVATDGSGTRQPITARPELGSGPFGSVLVFFGTGEYLGVSDVTLPGTQQTEYALLDTGSSSVISRTSDLVARTGSLSGGNVTVTGTAFSYSGASSKKGWYLDFPSSVAGGERSVTKPALGSGLLTFTTLTLAADICGAGSGYIYQVNALTGMPVDSSSSLIGYASTVGIPGPPRIVDLVLTTGASRTTGELINQRKQAALVSGTLAKIDSPRDSSSNPVTVTRKAPPVGRINWREISNWNDLSGN